MTLYKYLPVLFVLLILVGCATTTSNDAATPTPEASSLPAPDGFSWHIASNGVGAFLKPDGWFVKEESQEETNALFITKENIDTDGVFLTGMSINQINNLSTVSKLAPSQYAAFLISKVAKGKEVLKSGVVEGNPLDMHVVRILSDNAGVPTVIHYLSFGLDSKDQMYVINFESPESEWEANYQEASVMLNIFLIDN